MGCGFFIRDYFITAGHMFDDSESHTIFFNGDYHTFYKNDAVFIKSFKDATSDETAQDIAIFKFEGAESPLKLCGLMPYINSPLTSYSFIPVSGEKDPYVMIIAECRVKRTLFNFFECESSVILKRGSSGSPLIADNIVYGILSGCLDDLNKPEDILFCSTKNLPTL